MTPDDIPFATDQPTEDLTADVIVIGGGPVGENVAQYAIEDTDLTAILVEHELVGGECSYWACMPSKADRKSTRLNSSHVAISYAVFCLKKKNKQQSLCPTTQAIPNHPDQI